MAMPVGGKVTPMDHAEGSQVQRRETSRAPWIAATIVGLVAAVAWWAPSYPGDPWATIIAWLVWIGAALVGAALAYMLGARGKEVALASGLAVVVTFLAWPVILVVLLIIGYTVGLVASAAPRI